MAKNQKTLTDAVNEGMTTDELHDGLADGSISNTEQDYANPEAESDTSVTRFRIGLPTDQFKALNSVSRKTGIDRDMLIDMALQALNDAAPENIELYYQIAVARKRVDLDAFKGAF